MNDNYAFSSQQNISTFGEILSSARVIEDCKTPREAFGKYAAALKDNGKTLLIIADNDGPSETRPKFHYADIPTSLEKMCQSAVASATGCPIIRKAVADQAPFEALSASYPGYDDFASQRYFDEFCRLGHKEIAVIPLQQSHITFTSVIGLNHGNFTADERDSLTTLNRDFMVSLVTKFPDLAKSDIDLGKNEMPAKLTRLEIRVLKLQSEGIPNREIVDIIGLSENTILVLTSIARKKLNAKTNIHAILKASDLSLFD